MKTIPELAQEFYVQCSLLEDRNSYCRLLCMTGPRPPTAEHAQRLSSLMREIADHYLAVGASLRRLCDAKDREDEGDDVDLFQ